MRARRLAIDPVVMRSSSATGHVRCVLLMCTALFYYSCVYLYSLLNSCGYWTLNKYYYYYYYYYCWLSSLYKLNLLPWLLTYLRIK